jgi:hypothetical protein
MVQLDERGCLTFDTQLYGIGVLFEWLYQHFFLIRATMFVVSIFLYSYVFPTLFWLFILLEIFYMWCQFRAPLIDRAKREAFTEWIDEALTASGGESCHVLNAFLEQAYELMLPDYYSDWYCDLCTPLLRKVFPAIFKDVHAAKYTLGYRPSTVLQLHVEDNPPFPGSCSFWAPTVFCNETAFQWGFTIFGVKFTIVMTNVVSYGPIRFMLETPEETQFLNTAPVCAMGYTAPGNLKVLTATVYVNGFNTSKLPIVHYLWILYYEWLWRCMMGNGICHINDWITNTWRFRHISRYCTEGSEKLFKDIATEHPNHPVMERFSRGPGELRRWDERAKVFYDRIKQAQLAPNEEIIWMNPYPESELEPVFAYTEPRPPMTWADTQTDPVD